MYMTNEDWQRQKARTENKALILVLLLFFGWPIPVFVIFYGFGYLLGLDYKLCVGLLILFGLAVWAWFER